MFMLVWKGEVFSSDLKQQEGILRVTSKFLMMTGEVVWGFFVVVEGFVWFWCLVFFTDIKYKTIQGKLNILEY